MRFLVKSLATSKSGVNPPQSNSASARNQTTTDVTQQAINVAHAESSDQHINSSSSTKLDQPKRAPRPKKARRASQIPGPIISVPDMAARLNLRAERQNWIGANPLGNGATSDGFVLYAEGNAWDRKLDHHYSTAEVAKMAGIPPAEFEPFHEWLKTQPVATDPACVLAIPVATSFVLARNDGNQKAVKAKKQLFDWDSATKYDYTDENCNLLFEVGRIDYPDGTKEIRQRRPDGDSGWVYGLGAGWYEPTTRKGVTHWYAVKAKAKPSDKAREFPEVRRVLYLLADVIAAKTVIVCEGEKAADAFNADLRATGRYGEIVATTTSQGASNATKTDLSPLHGKDDVVLPDNDVPGQKYRDDILKALAGHAACKVIELPDRGEGGDYVDYRAAGHTFDEVLALIEAAPMYMASGPMPESEAAKLPFETFTFKDLEKLPRREWLIRQLLQDETTSVLSADSGGYKSFLALDMALCVATGRAFQGREVKQGTVVYVAAEGFFTMLERATAWAQFHNCELPENFRIVKVPVNVADAATRRDFADSIESYSPIFIVLDTLSQCSDGANENDNGTMANFMRGMLLLGQRIGAHVMVLHHNAKGTNSLRGAGSIKANVDTQISLDRPDGDEQNTVFVRCEKQRSRPFEPFALRGHELLLPYTDEYGDPVTSLVFEACSDAVASKTEKHPNAKKADKTRARLLEIFDEVAAKHDGVKAGTWSAAVAELTPPICSPSTFWAHKKALEANGEIERFGSHSGSDLYRRGASNPTTPTTPKHSYQSEGQKPDALHSDISNNPLGVGDVGVAHGWSPKPDTLFPERKPTSPPASKPHGVSPNALSEPAAYQGGEQ